MRNYPDLFCLFTFKDGYGFAYRLEFYSISADAHEMLSENILLPVMFFAFMMFAKL